MVGDGEARLVMMTVGRRLGSPVMAARLRPKLLPLLSPAVLKFGLPWCLASHGHVAKERPTGMIE